MSELLYSANAIPITPSHRLRLAFWNSSSQSSLDVAIIWRIQNKDGTISNNAEVVTVPANTLDQNHTFSLPYGELLAVTLSTFDTTLQNGELYAVITLQNGSVNDSRQKLPLISGYVLANAPLSYPLGDVRAVNSGLPASITQTFPDPAAGNDIVAVFGTAARARLSAGAFTYVADANAANRTVALRLFSNGVQFWQSLQNLQITANVNALVVLCKLPVPLTAPTDVFYIPLPDHIPVFNLTMDTVTTNIQAGDQISALFTITEQYASI